MKSRHTRFGLFIGVFFCSIFCTHGQFVSFESLENGIDYATTLEAGDVLTIEENVVVTIAEGYHVYFLATDEAQCSEPFNTSGLHVFMDGGLTFDPSNITEDLNYIEFGYNYDCSNLPFYISFDGSEPTPVLPSDIEIIIDNNIHLNHINGFVTVSGDFTTMTLAGTEMAIDNVNFQNQTQDCRLLNLAAEATTCSDLTFDVDVNFDHVGQSDSFSLLINTIDFGNYAYSDLPIRAHDLPGDGVTNYIAVVTDQNDPFCNIDHEIGTVLCGVDQCAIENLELSFGDCDEGTYPVTIDFDFTHVVDIRFRVTSPHGELGVFRYANLPVVVDYPSSSSLDQEFISVSDFEDNNCTDMVLFNGRDCSVPPCIINSMDVSVESCIDDSTFFNIDITAQNVSADFLLSINGNSMGEYPYDDLPIRVGPFGHNPDLAYSIYAEDLVSPFCNTTRQISPVVCPDTAYCNLFDIEVIRSDCQLGLFSAQINFSTFNVTDSFILLGNQVIYGRYGYDQLPIVIDDLIGDGTINYEFIVAGVTDDCQNTYRLGRVECPSCAIQIEDVTHGECNSDNTIDLIIDINYTNIEGEFVRLSGPQGDLGSYVITDEPLVVTYPTGSDPDYIIVASNDDPSCWDSIGLNLPDCIDELCIINEVTIEEYICDGSLYNAIINFTADNPSDSFLIRRGATTYGAFAYADLPVEFGPFPGDNASVIEVVIEDIAIDACSRLIEIGPHNCIPDEPCIINEVTIEEYICDGSLYNVIINFTADNPSDSFQIRRGTTIYGAYAYTDLPVEFGSFPGDNASVIEVVIEDIAIDACTRLIEIGPHNCIPVSVTDVQNADLRVYPSPSRDIIKIHFPEIIRSGDLLIYGLNGVILFQEKIESPDMRIDVHVLAQGSYILEAQTEYGVLRKKIVVIQ